MTKVYVLGVTALFLIWLGAVMATAELPVRYLANAFPWILLGMATYLLFPLHEGKKVPGPSIANRPRGYRGRRRMEG